MGSILQQICDDKRRWVQQRKTQIPLQNLEAQIISCADTPRGFYAALQKNVGERCTALIAEIKKASPSRGLIRAEFDPPALARAYTDGGATCLSILTDAPYFQGHDDYLRAARNATTLPCLRKDFMLDPYQITESRTLGADCVLLIMAALSDTHARELEQAALAHDMDVLVEIHDEAELERALTHLTSPLVGVNNRNLNTMAVDTGTTLRLAKQLPEDKLLVCESGIFTRDDVEQMQAAGIYAFLIGESLMRQTDVAAATEALIR